LRFTNNIFMIKNRVFNCTGLEHCIKKAKSIVVMWMPVECQILRLLNLVEGNPSKKIIQVTKRDMISQVPKELLEYALNKRFQRDSCD
jgi:hypothetical protein